MTIGVSATRATRATPTPSGSTPSSTVRLVSRASTKTLLGQATGVHALLAPPTPPTRVWAAPTSPTVSSTRRVIACMHAPAPLCTLCFHALTRVHGAMPVALARPNQPTGHCMHACTCSRAPSVFMPFVHRPLLPPTPSDSPSRASLLTKPMPVFLFPTHAPFSAPPHSTASLPAPAAAPAAAAAPAGECSDTDCIGAQGV